MLVGTLINAVRMFLLFGAIPDLPGFLFLRVNGYERGKVGSRGRAWDCSGGTGLFGRHGIINRAPTMGSYLFRMDL
jgi:hypothetical protein